MDLQENLKVIGHTIKVTNLNGDQNIYSEENEYGKNIVQNLKRVRLIIKTKWLGHYGNHYFDIIH